jgi:glycerol-1-phosphate dehydrogenase [NAD(P)+]
MDFEKLLNGIDNCPCGKAHKCDIEKIIIKKDAIKELKRLLSSYSNILLVADTNTYEICGERVKAILGDAVKDELIYPGVPLLVPDENAIKALNDSVKSETDIIIAVGSGVINDLCKLISYRRSRPYCIVATAPSMDGYASSVSAVIEGNMKITYAAHSPKFIIADLDVLKNAPYEMIQAGFGDTIGKYSALNDWLLSKIVNGEYFCETVYDMVYSVLQKNS